jgi:hypothetical protein
MDLQPSNMKQFCFYMSMKIGYCGWLTTDQLSQAMSEALNHEVIEVEDIPNIDKFGNTWYGFRLRATTEEAHEQDILFNGQLRTLAKRVFQQTDHIYYFIDEITRDTVKVYVKS